MRIKVRLYWDRILVDLGSEVLRLEIKKPEANFQILALIFGGYAVDTQLMYPEVFLGTDHDEQQHTMRENYRGRSKGS